MPTWNPDPNEPVRADWFRRVSATHYVNDGTGVELRYAYVTEKRTKRWLVREPQVVDRHRRMVTVGDWPVRFFAEDMAISRITRYPSELWRQAAGSRTDDA
jgi:hypothetical protein